MEKGKNYDNLILQPTPQAHSRFMKKARLSKNLSKEARQLSGDDSDQAAHPLSDTQQYTHSGET